MLPLGKESSEGNVTATIALIVGLLMIQACVRVALAVKSAAIPDVLSGKDLMQGNALSQAGGALFQVVGIAGALVGASLLPSWLVVVGGCGILIVAVIVGGQHAARRDAAAREHVRPGGAPRPVHDRGRPAARSRPARRRRSACSSFQMLRYQFWGFGLFTFALYAKNLVEGGDASSVALAISGRRRVRRRRARPGPRAEVEGQGAADPAAAGLDGRPRRRRRWSSARSCRWPGFAALLFIGFFAFFLGKISADTIMQQAMPDDFRGRAFALFDIAYNLGFIVPAFILSVPVGEGSAVTDARDPDGESARCSLG